MSSIPLVSLARDPRAFVLRENAVAECDPNSTKRLEWIRMFCESESDCTSEMGAGQFSIFGAVEEKSRSGFSRSGRSEGESESEVAGALDGAVFVCGARCAGNRVEGVGGMSTGRAQEMQKGGSEDQVPVLVRVNQNL
jgi:hypothetical protein